MSTAKDYPQRIWPEVNTGDVLPAIELLVEYSSIIHNAAATWDYFPGHHNPEYARAQGQPDIYVSTIFFHGFIDRLVTDWGGPLTFISRRKMRMVASVHPGQTMCAQGEVTRHYQNEQGHGLVDIDIKISTEQGLCVPSTVTARLPLQQGENLFPPTAIQKARALP